MPIKRILCVDDDNDTCELLTTLLSVSGFEAVCALNMTAALRLMEGEEFSLYILDGQSSAVPELSLCDLVREVDRHTPIIIFSGHAHRSDIEAGMRAGADAYLVKPDISELILTAKRLLEGKIRGEAPGL